jgi:hypothetical protein
MDTSKLVIKIATDVLASSHSVKIDIKLKSGEVIKSGTRCTKFDWSPDKRDAWVSITIEGREKHLALPVTALHKYITGFSKAPSISTMEKWSDDGVAKSITGERVEPDGTGPDGAPSWMLALGYI